MFIESFHRLLKIVYLQQKQNRRIDYLVHTLLRISKDKAYERLQKTHKGKYSHHISEINKRHKSALRMIQVGGALWESGNHWNVSSETERSQVYYVTKVLESCTNCKLTCSSCPTCVHMYTCTCLDFSLHTTVCKHVHMVCIKTSSTVHDQEKEVPKLQYFVDVGVGQQKAVLY